MVQADVPRPGAAAPELRHGGEGAGRTVDVEDRDGVDTPVRHVDPGPVGGDPRWLDEALAGRGRDDLRLAPAVAVPGRQPQLPAELAGHDQVVLRDDQVSRSETGGQPDRVTGLHQDALVQTQPVDLVTTEVTGQDLVAVDDDLVGVWPLLPVRDGATADELQRVADLRQAAGGGDRHHGQHARAIAGHDRVRAVVGDGDVAGAVAGRLDRGQQGERPVVVPAQAADPARTRLRGRQQDRQAGMADQPGRRGELHGGDLLESDALGGALVQQGADADGVALWLGVAADEDVAQGRSG